MKKFVLYPLAAFGAYVIAALATTRWWIRHAELNELLGQISDTPAPPVRPELVDARIDLLLEQVSASWDYEARLLGGGGR